MTLFNLNIGCIWMDLPTADAVQVLAFNLNIGCIWIADLPEKFKRPPPLFNLNIGCIWILHCIFAVQPTYLFNLNIGCIWIS